MVLQHRLRRCRPANFAGRIGAFIAELSYQLLGYSAYLVPLVLVVIGWHYFWCRALDAAYTKLLGAAPALWLRVLVPVARVRDSRDLGQGVPRGRLHRRSARGAPGRLPEPDRLDHPDPDAALPRRSSCRRSSRSGACSRSIGQLIRDRWAAMLGAYRARREERRREKQRQEVLKKHLEKAPKEADARPKDRRERGTADARRHRVRPSTPGARSRAPRPPDAAAEEGRHARRPWSTRPRRRSRPPPRGRRRPPRSSARRRRRSTPPLPLPEPEKLPAERQEGGLHASPSRAARRAEGRAQDRRARADGRRAAARGEVPRVRGRRRRSSRSTRARSSRPTSSSRTRA